MMIRSSLLLLATCATHVAEGFSVSSFYLPHAVPGATSTSIQMAKKKLSMKERRKQRAKKQPGFSVDRGILNELPSVDTWEKTEASVGAKRENIQPDGSDADVETEETMAKASALVQTQRKSVDCLTHIRKRVEESFPISEAANSLAEKGYFVYDGFLSKEVEGDSKEDAVFGDSMVTDMLSECSDMFTNDKLQRDISHLADGEFVSQITGGENYSDCPRLTEFVVSITRHLPPLLNKEFDKLGPGDLPYLDATASMGSLRLYDRKTKLGTMSFLSGDDTSGSDENVSERPFKVVCGDSDAADNDSRRVTAIFYLSPEQWDSCHGGGLTIESDGQRVEAKRDRIVLLRSDTCSHRQEPWKGSDESGLDKASSVIVHFIKG